MKIGNVTIISGQGGYEMRKSSKTGPGEEFARYNPSNEDSIRDAARYVGATKTETAGVIRYHRAASVVGRARGSVRSEAKTRTARENGKRGGRPRKYTYDEVAPIALRDVEALLVHHGGWDAGDVDEILTDEERDRYAADIERAVRNLVALLNGSDCHSDAETREARISITRGIL